MCTKSFVYIVKISPDLLRKVVYYIHAYVEFTLELIKLYN